MGQVGEEAQKSVIQRVFQQVAQRPDSFCNYLEGIIPEWGEGTKLIYRHYATLYFVFAVDSQESDLGILDLVQGEESTIPSPVTPGVLRQLATVPRYRDVSFALQW